MLITMLLVLIKSLSLSLFIHESVRKIKFSIVLLLLALLQIINYFLDPV